MRETLIVRDVASDEPKQTDPRYISEAALRTTEGNNATRWPDASVRPLNRYQIDDMVDD